MTIPALGLYKVTKRFGMTSILAGVDLEVSPGERHAIIGPNGAGKSTLFNVVSGRLAPTSGDIHLNGISIARHSPHRIQRQGLARNFQVTNLFNQLSVFDNLRCGVLGASGHGLTFWRGLSGLSGIRERTETILALIGLEHRRDVAMGVLSYAEQRALEIGVALSGGSQVLLLDEPTAGMSHHETERTIALIRRVTAGKTLLVVEHDMGVVFELADRISVLVYGEIIASGRPDEIRRNARVQEAYLGQVGEPAPAGTTR